ncbi:ABC transporter ATP-binding protein [Candidatus Deferrimicrobium sp.]|uniref:ABC transporter ATP-binding protein n=1 Tax=Candidatus Deferrimicrobium sp. TaxID=3060586 RepID=UPI002ED2B03C
MTRRLSSLWRFVRPERRTLAVTFLFSLLGTGASLYAPLLTRRMVDDVILRSNWPAFPRLLATMVLFGAAGSVLGGFSSYLYTRGSSRILVAMRAALFEHLERAEMRFFARTRVGEIVARLNNDMVEVQGVLVDVPLAFVTSVVRLGIASAILISMSWSLFLIGNVLVPLGALGLWLTRDVITRMSRELREKNAAVGTHIIDTFTGIRLVRGSATEGQELQRFERENLSLVASVLRFQMVSSLSRGIPSFVLACSATLALLYGGYMVRDGAITVGTLVAFTAFQVQVISPIQNLLGQYVALRKGKASLARVFEFFDVPAEEDAEGAVAFTGAAKGIVFEGVTFAYGAEGRVLDGLSLEIPAGGTFALVGESGAGKSTLVDLLLRYYEPQGGEIRLDGVPLRRLRRATLRRKIALVSTDPYLFHGSLGENVRYGAADADDSKVADAIAKADLADLVRSLPKGLSTVVGERGVTLSDGQRQRVALARAFLRSPEILVLDEATSSLDLLSEERIRRAIQELMHGKTTLIVTHRVHAVRDADRIAVLENGRVSHIGTHAELAGRRGAYRSFLRVCGDGADGAGEGCRA